MKKTEFRIAKSKSELIKSYEIVASEWKKLGYIETSGGDLKYSIYNALPNTTTFVGINEEGVIFMTATIIVDSPLGLPIDTTFKDKIDELRVQHNKIAEVSMLAFDSTNTASTGLMRLKTLLEMFMVIFDYAQFSGTDAICAKVHPRHGASYDNLLFRDLGEVRQNKNVSNMPVSAKVLDLKELAKTCQEESKRDNFPCNLFFKTETKPRSDFNNTRFRFSADDFEDLFINKQNLLKQLNPEQLNFIKNQYPEIDFKNLI